MHGSRGCFGCCFKPKLTTSVDAPSNKVEIDNPKVKKPSRSEDFWSTTTFDMDNSAVQSQGSISSISISNQALDPNGVGGTASTSNEFVSHGLLLWNQTRQRWIGNKKRENNEQQVREPKLSWNATYESLLGSDKPFPQPIPLPEMVDFLVDNWDQEGLYD